MLWSARPDEYAVEPNSSAELCQCGNTSKNLAIGAILANTRQGRRGEKFASWICAVMPPRFEFGVRAVTRAASMEGARWSGSLL